MRREPPEAVRRRAGRLWAQRFTAELSMAERFGLLAEQLERRGVSRTTLEMARQARSDELRHAELCRRLAAHFGVVRLRRPEAPRRSLAPARLAPEQGLLYDVIATACVTETLSTALLGALVESARDSLAKETMRSILRDEVQHSRLGWRVLAELGAERGDLGAYLPNMLQGTFSAELFDPDPTSDAPSALTGLGGLERHRRRSVVRDTLELVVFPGLERFGIDVEQGRRWLGERVPAAAPEEARKTD